MRFREQCWLVASSVILAGCVSTPDSYPVPQQHAPFRPSGIPASEFLPMSHPDVRKSIVKDIDSHEPGPWRWTGADPELRFQLASANRRTAVVEFVINDRTFRETGPVTVSFYVNDHLLGKEQYTSDGDKAFEKPVPADWLSVGAEARLRMHVHNTWRSPGNTILGILLKRAGFVE